MPRMAITTLVGQDGQTMETKIVDAIKVDIGTAVATYKGLGITASFFSFFQGRATCFAIVFTICGLIGFFRHYDLTSYALFVGAIQVMVVGHSIKEDYFARRDRQDNQDQGK